MVRATMSSKKDFPLQILCRKGTSATASPNASRVFTNSKGRAAATPDSRRPSTKQSAQRVSPTVRLMGVEGSRNEERPSKRGRRSSESDAQAQPRLKMDAVPCVMDSRYASAKYREPPEPAVLPLPPTEWVQSCSGDYSVKTMSRDLKTMLRLSVPVEA